MSHLDAEEWAQAYVEEYSGFMEQGATVFEEIYPSAGEKVISSKATNSTNIKSECVFVVINNLLSR